jgi:hypothetical protein
MSELYRYKDRWVGVGPVSGWCRHQHFMEERAYKCLHRYKHIYDLAGGLSDRKVYESTSNALGFSGDRGYYIKDDEAAND